MNKFKVGDKVHVVNNPKFPSRRRWTIVSIERDAYNPAQTLFTLNDTCWDVVIDEDTQLVSAETPVTRLITLLTRYEETDTFFNEADANDEFNEAHKLAGELETIQGEIIKLLINYSAEIKRTLSRED